MEEKIKNLVKIIEAYTKFISKPHFHDSLIIILRTLISDTITFYYILNKSVENDDLKSNIKWLYSDHLRYVENNLRKTYKITNKLSDTEVENKINDLIKKRADFYDTEGKLKFKKPLPSTSGMIQSIFSDNQGDVDLAHLKRAFSLYDLFSKYEHFGDLSFQLIHRQFQEKYDRQIIYEEIVDTVHIVQDTIDRTLRAWPKLKTQHESDLVAYYNKVLALVS